MTNAQLTSVEHRPEVQKIDDHLALRDAENLKAINAFGSVIVGEFENSWKIHNASHAIKRTFVDYAADRTWEYLVRDELVLEYITRTLKRFDKDSLQRLMLTVALGLQSRQLVSSQAESEPITAGMDLLVGLDES